jgi:hypothetical protein
MKITESFIANLAASPTKKVFFDDDFPAFGVRSYESGKKSYVIRYKIGHRQYLKTIANCRDMLLSSALAIAKRELSNLSHQ